jgi:hypothetical protein
MSDDRTDEEDTRPSRALAKLSADERGILPIIPRDVEEAQRYANGLIAANQVPSSFRTNPKDSSSPPNGPLILMGVMKSMEVGLPPQTGLEVLLPMNGRFVLWGEGPIGLALQSGKVKNYVEREIGPQFDVAATELAEWPQDYGFTVNIWRVGMEDPFIGRFTVADARRQRLWLNTYKKPWIESPRRMLKIRARAFALRDGFADCLMGLGIKEEIEDSLPPQIEGGDLKPAGLPSYLSDEPVTDEAPTAAESAEPQRDLGTDQDMGKDF